MTFPYETAYSYLTPPSFPAAPEASCASETTHHQSSQMKFHDINDQTATKKKQINEGMKYFHVYQRKLT